MRHQSPEALRDIPGYVAWQRMGEGQAGEEFLSALLWGQAKVGPDYTFEPKGGDQPDLDRDKASQAAFESAANIDTINEQRTPPSDASPRMA